METPHEIAKRYGFVCRSSLDGYFIRYGNGDDVAKIDHKGKVILYAHDAQAYIAATAIADHLTGIE